jgi:hypothetical protein
MTFFKTLSEIGITDVIIQFETTTDGNVSVFVSPKAITNTNAIRLLKPIFLSGEAEQVDLVFYEKLAAHMIDINDALKEELAAAKVAKETAKPKATTKAKAKTAPEMVKEIVEAQAEEVAVAEEVVGEVAPTTEEVVEKALKEKVLKTNNEKELKTFMATIKDEPIINHKDAIQFLLDNLTEEELAKPYNAGIKKDLDEAAKKEAQKIAFRLANGYKKETAPDAVEEVAEVEKVIAVDVIDDVAFVTTEVVQEEAETVVEEVAEELRPVLEEPRSVVEEEVTEIVVAQEELVAPQPEPVVPAPMAVVKTELKFQMIATDYTYEQYINVGWTNETLVQMGYAHWVEVPVQ